MKITPVSGKNNTYIIENQWDCPDDDYCGYTLAHFSEKGHDNKRFAGFHPKEKTHWEFTPAS